MITLREAAQNVVDALIKNPTRVSKEVHIASVVLREVLAQPEPDDGYCQACDEDSCTAKEGCVARDNPPQRECASTVHDRREWQGLTFDDWPLPQYEYSADFQIGAQWAEAKLKEKNRE